MKPKYFFQTLLCMAIFTSFVLTAKDGFSHARWTKRDEPGEWTVVLYHFDDEDLNEGFSLFDEGPNGLNLLIGPPQDSTIFGDPLPAEQITGVNGNKRFLAQALECVSPQTLSATKTVTHPFTLSFEIWLKPIDLGADFRFGFLDGISVRIRHNKDEGDRFHILGTNSDGIDDLTFQAPGFDEFPNVPTWNHYGVTIRCPYVEWIGDGMYRYGEGTTARFFYFSHAVGFTGERTLDLSGLEFPETATPGIEIYSGIFDIDEFQISNVDWHLSQDASHGGAGAGEHGSETTLEHAFENGRAPGDYIPPQPDTTVPVADWALY